MTNSNLKPPYQQLAEINQKYNISQEARLEYELLFKEIISKLSKQKTIWQMIKIKINI